MKTKMFDKAFIHLVGEKERIENAGDAEILWAMEHTFTCIKPNIVVQMAKDPETKQEAGANLRVMSDTFLDSLTPVFSSDIQRL